MALSPPCTHTALNLNLAQLFMKVTHIIHDGLLWCCSCSPVGIHLGLEDARGYRRVQEEPGCRMQGDAGGCRRMQEAGCRMQKDKGGCRRTQKDAEGCRRILEAAEGLHWAPCSTVTPFCLWGQFWGCAAVHRRDLVVSPLCVLSTVSSGIGGVEHPTVPRVCCCDVLL